MQIRIQPGVRGVGIAISALMFMMADPSHAAADAHEVLASVSRTLGADTLKSLEYTGSGHDYVLGQAPTVKSPWPKFNDKTYTRVVSFEPWASRLQRIRTQFENPPRGGGQQPIVGEQNQTQVVAPGSPAAAALPDDLAITFPQAFVKVAAAAQDVTTSTASKGGKKYTVITFTAGNKARTSGWINANNLVERVETKIDNNVLGDISYEAAFTDYKDFNGIQFPSHIVQRQGGYPVLDLNITDVKPNVVGDFSPAAGAPPPPAPLASEKLGEGVFLITGGYAAVAVDFKDHITIIEGGQSDQRSAAVMAEAARLIPGKPITEVINTHAHFDHLGGIRAYVAAGATVVTHRSNKSYYQKIWANPHTLVPDQLALRPRKANFRLVGDNLTLTDGNQVIELYHQHEYGHHDGMLLAYLPKLKVLVEADGFNPPPAPVTQTPAVIVPYPQNLAANIERLNLDVQRIIPIHLPADGRTVTMAELNKVIGKN